MKNDDSMIFDESKQRYVLTVQCALDNNVDLEHELDTSGGPAKNNLALHILDRISRTVYNFIYSHGNMEIKRRMLAENDEYRPFIKDAMIEQLLYFMANGDLNALARIDMQNGREYTSAAKRDAAYAPEMQNILAQTDLLYCGFMGG